MYTIVADNVNEALPLAIGYLNMYGELISPRGIETIEAPTPVCTTYRYPKERVLLTPERDANPFFHLMESLWILAGRSDVEWLSQFNKRMREYSDDGEVFNAPYGYRLRSHFGVDQITEAIKVLEKDKHSRQCVLQIWDVCWDLNVQSKDIPCNDLVFLKIRNGSLNMTVCNRSNDVLWGAYGANVVQFSMLQEYIASKLGVEVGQYRQVSDSFHVYPETDVWQRVNSISYSDFNPYRYGQVTPYPIMDAPLLWDEDLSRFMCESDTGLFSYTRYSNPFFIDVVIPMFLLWIAHKQNGDALHNIAMVQATDWQLAARQWLAKREHTI